MSLNLCAWKPTHSAETTLTTTSQVLGIKALDRAKKVLKSARPLRIIHRVKVRVGGIAHFGTNKRDLPRPFKQTVIVAKHSKESKTSATSFLGALQLPINFPPVF